MSRRRIDITGQRFGMLIALYPSDQRQGFWACKCDCGNTKEIYGSSLRSGQTKSCGCRGRKTDQLSHSVGIKIQNICKRRHISKTKLAQDCGVSRGAVGHWENNIRIPTDDNLTMIAQVLNVNVASLIDRHIRSMTDVIHILFEIAEDGSIVPDADGIRITNDILRDALAQWYDKHEQWKSGQITNEEYYDWQDAFTVADLSEKEKMEEMKNET